MSDLKRQLSMVLPAALAIFGAAAIVSAGDDAALDRARFSDRLEHLSDDSDACLTLGAWGLDRGLVDDVDLLYRQFLRSHPDDTAVTTALIELWAERTPARDSPAYRATRALLEGEFATHETSRFIILSEADTQWTRQQAEHLERAFHQFCRFTRRLGLRPLPLKEKLVCVLFDDRARYRSFALNHDAVPNPDICGYYSPRTNRMVFYNPRSNPHVTASSQRLAEARAELKTLLQRADQIESAGQKANADAIREAAIERELEIDAEASRVEALANELSIATTVHEAIHHLMFETRIQSPHVEYPLWICEGLATAFETDRPGQAFGPRYEYGPRRDGFVASMETGRLLPLEDLVTILELVHLSPDDTRVIYHQSYALVSWLVRFRASDLRTYLRLMRASQRGRRTAAEHLAAFESAFGDVQSLERAWLRYERSVAPAARRDHVGTSGARAIR